MINKIHFCVHLINFLKSCPNRAKTRFKKIPSEKFKNAKIVLGAGNSVACADILIKDGESLQFGAYAVNTMATPSLLGFIHRINNNRLFGV
jgi:hypothetical protein